MHCKPSRKSYNGKTNIRIIFFGDTVYQGTFEHIYDICLIKNFGGGGSLIRNNKVGGFEFVVVNDKAYFFDRVSRENIFFG